MLLGVGSIVYYCLHCWHCRATHAQKLLSLTALPRNTRSAVAGTAGTATQHTLSSCWHCCHRHATHSQYQLSHAPLDHESNIDLVQATTLARGPNIYIASANTLLILLLLVLLSYCHYNTIAQLNQCCCNLMLMPESVQ